MAKKSKSSSIDFASIVAQHRSDIDMDKLATFSASIGLSVRSLQAYGVGYDRERKTWSFTMRDARREIVGIYHLNDAGDASATPGSKLGLFIPEDYAPADLSAICDDGAPNVMILPGGIYDACAAFDLGFPAIARTSNASGGAMVAGLLGGIDVRQEAFVVSTDCSPMFSGGQPFWPDLEGAIDLMGQIVNVADVRFLLMPKGHNSLYSWFRDGCTSYHLLAHMRASPRVTADTVAKYKRRMETKRQEVKVPA